MSNNVSFFKTIFIICIVLTFFNCWGIFFAQTDVASFPVAVIFYAILYITLLFKKRFYNFVLSVFQLKIFKYLLYFVVFLILSFFINYDSGLFWGYFFSWIKLYILMVLLLLLPVASSFINIKLKTVNKILCCTLYFIILSGILQYIAFVLNIGFIKILSNIFTNMRSFDDNLIGCQESLRVYSVFMEPSAFGQVLFIFMPIVIKTALSKYKIFKNKHFNFIYKKTVIPIMLLDVILTKSPIYCVLCFLEFAVIFIMLNWKKIKKYFLIINGTFVLSVFVLFLMLQNIFGNIIKNSFLERIFQTLESYGSLSLLIIKEPSLATRILYYKLYFIAFKQNILFGCGFLNANAYANKIFFLVPHTQEMIIRYMSSSKTINAANSLIWCLLAETGIIGTSLYILFVWKLFISLKKILTAFSGFEKDFCLGCQMSIISIFILSFYNLDLYNTFIWLIYGFAILYIYKYKLIIKSTFIREVK